MEDIKKKGEKEIFREVDLCPDLLKKVRVTGETC
jgi:hypothetical protein